MNWDAVAAVGEILGAIAVLATLIYLAVQVRHNAASAAAATFESALSGWNHINLVIAADGELGSILSRGLAAPESLSEEESIRFVFLMRSAANQFTKLLYLYGRKAISRDDWLTFGTEAVQIFSTPGGRRFRRDHPTYEPLFTAIDQLTGHPGLGPEFGPADPDRGVEEPSDP